jgi:hypothetical protein
MKCYFARSVALYGTKQDERDLDVIRFMGFDVVDPATMDKEYEASGRAFGFFTRQVEQCDILIFRGNPEGSIGAGVAAEIRAAISESLPVLELPCGIDRRSLSIDHTREYLRDIGCR